MVPPVLPALRLTGLTEDARGDAGLLAVAVLLAVAGLAVPTEARAEGALEETLVAVVDVFFLGGISVLFLLCHLAR